MNGNKEGRNRRKTGRSQKKKEKGVVIRIRRKNQVKPGQSRSGHPDSSEE